uniref:Uncharacterized protein n=1 Tax=uncultured bacterium esnapd21 TaxID=1366603 RepID=S5TLK4_9BACT|nr:hypothetical protein [uncultured bacterium esnapd21]
MLKRIAHFLLDRYISRQHRYDGAHYDRKPWKKSKKARHKRPWHAGYPNPPYNRGAYEGDPYGYQRPRGLKAAIFEALLYRLTRR